MLSIAYLAFSPGFSMMPLRDSLGNGQTLTGAFLATGTLAGGSFAHLEKLYHFICWDAPPWPQAEMMA
jgi:hypothetical protein